MKKVITISLILGVVLVIVGFVIAGNNYENQRYLVKSNNGMLKMMYGVQHNFDKGFTTDLTPGQLKVLEKFGVKVEKVELYQITGKPVCGNGIIEGGEKCGEPGLFCSIGYVCENCKCVGETISEERTCYPSIQKPWGIQKVNGGTGGAGVNVAVLDTGIYKDHLDLDVKMCKDTTKRGIKNGCSDRNGYGTHVAGTIAANGGSDGKGIFGVAPEANLFVIKVCGNSGFCFGDDIAEAIRYVTDRGANIISMSLGGDSQSSLIRDAINYATENGVLVIAAAGNDGPSDGSIDYPGANVKVVAVGAIDSTETVSSWSSRGINDGDYVIEEREVEFGAPGVLVESTWNNGCYNIISGTSMATPHIAGMAAKLWQGNAIDTRTHLQSIAKDIWTNGDDTATGFGLPITLTE